MNVGVGQIYIRPGIKFPFSHHMQIWLGERLEALDLPAPEFEKRYGGDFTLMLNLSAKERLDALEVKGPTVFKTDKDVEYTIFLPFDVITAASDPRRTASEHLVDGIKAVFNLCGVHTEHLERARSEIVEHLCSDPTMVTEAWGASNIPNQGSRTGPQD